MTDPVTARETPSAAQAALSKVPEATVLFWVIKVITTGMGEIVADAAAERIGLPVTALIGVALTTAALIWQFRQPRYRVLPYWTAAAMVSILGTSVGDGPRRALGLAFETTSAVLGLLVVLILLAWYRSERTISIHTITSHRREAFYWLTVGATFALGTAVGDMFTHFGVSFLVAAAIFAAAMLVALAAHRVLHVNGVAAFWFAYVLTRPLGASVADWTWVPAPYGAGLGKDLTGGVSVVLFLIVLAYMVRTRNGEPRPDASLA